MAAMLNAHDLLFAALAGTGIGHACSKPWIMPARAGKHVGAKGPQRALDLLMSGRQPAAWGDCLLELP